MSHVLHVWEGPAPESTDDAAALVESNGDGRLAASARFGDFAAALRKKHPDAHTLEARGKDPEKSVWADSPLTGETPGPFMVLGLRLENVDRKVIHFIVKTAGAHGLHTYDTQTGELWRKDDPPPSPERVKPPKLPKPELPMRELHRFARMPEWSDEDLAPRPLTEPGSRMDVGLGEAYDRVVEPILRRLANHGWTASTVEGTGRRLAWRSVGPARQVLRLYVFDPIAGGSPRPLERVEFYSVIVEFHFDVPSVQELLFGIHPGWRKKRVAVRKRETDAYADVEPRIHEIFGMEAWEALHYKPVSPLMAAPKLRSGADLDWWAGLFATWYERQAEPLLAACTDLTALNRFLDNPYRLWNGMQDGSDWGLMATLALARMAPHDDVPWADCLTGVRYRADRLALDEALIERTIAALESRGMEDAR